MPQGVVVSVHSWLVDAVSALLSPGNVPDDTPSGRTDHNRHPPDQRNAYSATPAQYHMRADNQSQVSVVVAASPLHFDDAGNQLDRSPVPAARRSGAWKTGKGQQQQARCPA